jgi:L-lactate dehydrogenase (cytochrome)
MVLPHPLIPVTPRDYRRLAERRLPRFLFDYLDGGANDEITLAANVSDFQALRIRQKTLADVSDIDTSSVMMGEKVAMPLALAPIGMAGIFARRGEALRAARAADVPFTLSTVGVCPIDELRSTAQNFWFQLYMIRDRGVIEALLDRAAAAGCGTLLFTVDLPLTGMRHRDERNGMMAAGLKGQLLRAMQIAARPRWVVDVGLQGKPHSLGNFAGLVPGAEDVTSIRQWVSAQFDPSVTWKDIEWLRGRWKGKLVLKGLQEVEDATEAVKAGADGLIVSNHGGRQLDSVASSISKLAPIVDAVGEKIEVYVDGGVRGGVDIFKALALGARGVLIGRPWAWALAGAGEQGVADLLKIFRQELRVAMALSGVTGIGQIGRRHLDGGAGAGTGLT